MNKLLTKIIGVALGLGLATGVGAGVIAGNRNITKAEASSETITSTFTSKSWTDVDSLWNSDKDASQLDGTKGPAVQKAETGAGATTKASYNNVSAVSIWLSKSSKGVGSVTLKVGSTSILTQSTFASDPTEYQGTINSALTGKISFSVTCTTSTIYVKKVSWTYDDGGNVTKYSLTYAPGDHGTHDGSTTKVFEVSENTNATIKTPAEVGITANSGYIFSNWSDGVNTYNPGESYPMGTSNHTLTAQWTEVTYYNLVSDASTLLPGTSFILLDATSDSIAVGSHSGSFFTTTSATYDSVNRKAASAGATIFTLESAVGGWNIKFDNLYLNAADSTTLSKGELADTNNYKWEISISNNIANISAKTSGRSIAYNYNNGNPRYANYTISNTYTAVRIFAIIPEIEEYSITSTITNGTASGDSTILENGSASVTIAPNDGYKLPSTISVTGAEYSYDSNTGVVTLSAPTGNVTISASMVAATQYSISTNLTGLTATGATTIYENGTASVTLSVIDTATKALPKTISVSNAVDYSYNTSSGVVTINGATGNVTITASAVDKPFEQTEDFVFAANHAGWTEVTAGEEYTKTVNLITVTWNKNSGSAISYWAPARIYTNHSITISAVTGAGAVDTIKSVIINANTAAYATSTQSSNVTLEVAMPTIGAGTVSSTVDDKVVTITSSGTVTEINITVSGKDQIRWDSLSVVYEKDQTEVPLTSISATCDSVLVSQQVSPVITWNPVTTSNKNVSYEIVENTSSIAEVDENGVVTGKGAGTARLKITPEAKPSAAITIDVAVNALPNIYGVEVGKKYAMTASLNSLDFELDGIATASGYTYGSGTSYNDDPENLLPIRIVNGLYAKTVALEVTINSETKYLSYDASNSSNNLNLTSSIERASSWIFAQEDSNLIIRNVQNYERKLAATTSGTPAVGRFACYQNLSESVVTPTFVEIEEVKTDKEYVQDFVDLYMHMTDYDQGGTVGSTNGSGWCKDGQHSYYLTAKAGFNRLTPAQQSLFQSDSDFDLAQARYEAWAEANNDGAPYDGNDTVVTTLHTNNIMSITLNNNGTTTIMTIVIIAIVMTTSTGAIFLLRKKKEER